jgi:tetratricopeptide (TPR) repeat protein
MRILVLSAAIAAFPIAVLAAGSDSSSPPSGTETTGQCTDGKVWDASTKACIAPKHSGLSDEVLISAARELAYDGQYAAVLAVLDAVSDPEDDMVLTYRGFAHRKMGDMKTGMAWYARALDRNPDNILARSYMGQGFLQDGDLLGARAQLLEIRDRGGEDTWAEASLEQAILTGTAPSY